MTDQRPSTSQQIPAITTGDAVLAAVQDLAVHVQQLSTRVDQLADVAEWVEDKRRAEAEAELEARVRAKIAAEAEEQEKSRHDAELAQLRQEEELRKARLRNATLKAAAAVVAAAAAALIAWFGAAHDDHRQANSTDKPGALQHDP